MPSERAECSHSMIQCVPSESLRHCKLPNQCFYRNHTTLQLCACVPPLPIIPKILTTLRLCPCVPPLPSLPQITDPTEIFARLYGSVRASLSSLFRHRDPSAWTWAKSISTCCSAMLWSWASSHLESTGSGFLSTTPLNTLRMCRKHT